MSRQSENVKKWRQRFKQRIIDSMGGCCQCCGYDKCNSALELHHINPEEKELAFGSLVSSPKGWKDYVVPELRKCILVCSNCHREIHAEIRKLPDDFQSFDEEYLDYHNKNDSLTPCPKCGQPKDIKQRFCSYKCSSSAAAKINWDKYDLKALIDSGKTYQQIADIIDCSLGAVSKRARKLGFTPKQKQINWPSNEELAKLVWEKPIVHLAKDLGVSDKALIKRCLKFKIKKPPAGYWNKPEN